MYRSVRNENNLGIQNERDDDSGLKLPELGNYHNVSVFEDLAPPPLSTCHTRWGMHVSEQLLIL